MRKIAIVIPVMLIFSWLTVGCVNKTISEPSISKLNMDTIGTGVRLTAAKDLSETDFEKIRQDVDDLIGYCSPILSGKEKESRNQAEIAFWLSTAGLLAGAVAAPALIAASPSGNAVWIAATSGFAGATNAVVGNMKTSGLSGFTVATERNDIINRIRSKMEIICDPEKTLSEIRAALITAKSECMLYYMTVPDIVISE